MVICSDQRPIANSLFGSFATRAAASDINTYKTAQIIGKSRSGGVQGGFSRSWYHLPGLNNSPAVAGTAQIAK
jgi:hypothetical protein